MKLHILCLPLLLSILGCASMDRTSQYEAGYGSLGTAAGAGAGYGLGLLTGAPEIGALGGAAQGLSFGTQYGAKKSAEENFKRMAQREALFKNQTLKMMTQTVYETK